MTASARTDPALKTDSDAERKLLARVREIGSYEDGWNGIGSQGPNARAVDDAEIFLRTLDLSASRVPFITLTDDGEINFLWKLPNIHLDLGFFGDSKYSYFGRTAAGLTFKADNRPVAESLPNELIELLSVDA